MALDTKKRQCTSSVVEESLHCTICREFIEGYISQCKNGHIYCSGCICKITKCGLCRADISTIRCLVLEQIRETIDVKCPRAGCDFVGPVSHRDSCKYHRCDKVECKFIGTPLALQNHNTYVCPYRLFKCDLSHGEDVYCDKTVKYCDLETHFNEFTREFINEGRKLFCGCLRTISHESSEITLCKVGNDRFLIGIDRVNKNMLNIRILSRFKIGADCDEFNDVTTYKYLITDGKKLKIECSFKTSDNHAKVYIPDYYDTEDVKCSLMFNMKSRKGGNN